MDRSLQTPNHSLPWYQVVELVRTEDLLYLFFYFGLVRMQETGREKTNTDETSINFSSYCHKCILAALLVWFCPSSSYRTALRALQDDRLRQGEGEDAQYHAGITINFSSKLIHNIQTNGSSGVWHLGTSYLGSKDRYILLERLILACSMKLFKCLFNWPFSNTQLTSTKVHTSYYQIEQFTCRLNSIEIP